MTISTELRKAGPFTGNGVTTAFPFSFKVFAATDVTATRADTLGAETGLVLNTDFTVALNADQDAAPGGTVTLAAPLSTGYRLVVSSAVPNLQPTDITNNGGFYPRVIEDALDRHVAQVQQIDEKVGRALKVAITSPLGDQALPSPVAGMLIGWNESSDGLKNYAPIGGTLLGQQLAAANGSSLVGFQQAGTGAVVRTAQDKMRERISVFDFMTAAQIASVQARNLTEDVTTAVQAGVNRAISVGAILFFPAGSYKVTDTISLLNANSSYSAGMQGENGNSTRIYFYNSTSLKTMFYVDSDVNYLTVSDLEFIDNTARTSRGFYFFDTTATAGPAWKHLFRNVRITAFKEGVRFDGGVTTGDDTHQSEVMFLHSKTRNCETGLIYNNTQAVNHQLIGFDMENDAEGASEEWTHIKLERGTSINHIGGSVIGNGSYLKYTYSVAGSFQYTSQFLSKGVRVEKRGGSSPVINHDTSSSITLTNFLRIDIEDMPVVASGGATLFARFGGHTFAKFSNVHANVQMDVEAYITSNLAANGEYGWIVIEDCKALNYKRVSTLTAYGSAGVAASNYRSIPAEISIKNENVLGVNDGEGYYSVNAQRQTVYAGGLQVSQIKTLVYSNADNAGFGSGSDPAAIQINLPKYGRPCKFRLLRDDVNAGSAFVMSLYAVVGGVDYLLASITPTAAMGGHFEANIQTLTGLIYFVNDGVNWDGKMKVVKSGAVHGYVGLFMIDYM